MPHFIIVLKHVEEINLKQGKHWKNTGSNTASTWLTHGSNRVRVGVKQSQHGDTSGEFVHGSWSMEHGAWRMPSSALIAPPPSIYSTYVHIW